MTLFTSIIHRHSSLLALLCVIVSSALVSAHTPGSNHQNLARRLHSANASVADTKSNGLHKRVDNARMTYYYQTGDQNACGGLDHDTDFIVALNSDQFGNGENCWKMITIEYQGKQHSAQITDECPGCPWGGLDLTPSLFTYLAGSLGPGVLSASWDFADGSSSTTTTSDPPAETHTTKSSTTHTTHTTPHTTSTTSHSSSEHHTTSTSTWSPPPSSSSSPSSTKTTVSSSSHSSSSVHSTSTTSSATPTTTVTSFDKGTLEQLNLAILQLVGVADAAAVAAASSTSGV